MRICVFGAGAVGGHLAAKFAAAGHEVSVVARGANLQGINANGIALREGARTIVGRVRAIGGVVYSSNDVAEPGVVLNYTGGRNMLVIGETDDRHSARIEALRALRERVLVEGRAIAGVAAPTLEARSAITARLAARKGLYWPQ